MKLTPNTLLVVSIISLLVGIGAYKLWGGADSTGIDQQLIDQVQGSKEWGK